MRIGLNATCFDDRPTGAVQRFRGIYRALALRRPDFEFVVYEPSDSSPSEAFGDLPNFRAVKTTVRAGGAIRRAITGGLRLRSQLRADRLDLFEMFNLPLVKAPDCPTILTIHDFRPVEARLPFPIGQINRRIMARSFEGADMTITVSETMRQVLETLFPGTRSAMLYNGLDWTQFAPDTAAQIAGSTPQLGLAAPYILAVGHLEARKNNVRLVESIARLRDLGRPEHLVLVGKDHGEQSHIEQTVAEYGLADRVHILSDVDDESLRRLYQGAALVSIPSLYEGFGIPLIEAMASRCPLITSGIPVFRELTEDRGAYYDATDPVDIAARTATLLGDPAAQQALIEYGARRVRDFGFGSIAARLERIYERVLASN